MNTFSYDVIVIGTGAAGYNAAVRLKSFGKNVAIVTENINFGTSRNTGSDKQTYYKLGLGGDSPDSVRNMAENLFAGGAVDGDNALCEAALSVRCFMNLCELGVAFPVNRYGEYVGYKTDHDPYARATSAGPLTSKFMTEALEKKAKELNIDIFSGYLAIEVLKNNEKVCGLLTVEQKSGEFVAFRTGNIIMATGGPAGIYSDSVYPICHTGSTSLALLAGAKAQNLTEWQYGLASVNPRWNVSGTYMQVLPRFVSIDEDGTEHEFLNDFYSDNYKALSDVFMKGYQWPFDCAKVGSGSSVIDILVYRECAFRNRRVYLDYTKNPFGLQNIEYDKLSDEAYSYLENAQACFGTPIERLLKMNAPAVELYKSKGLDITKDYLEIALCAQHNNGGISVDLWWQTSIDGLFAAGECAGTHGVTRPGGSALNAGQVGSLRAALYISKKGNPLPPSDIFDSSLDIAYSKHSEYKKKIIGNKDSNIREIISKTQKRMSISASAIRNTDNMLSVLEDTEKDYANILEISKCKSDSDFYKFYKLRDILFTQIAVLKSMIFYADAFKDSRGSALYTNKEGTLREGLEETFRFCKENTENRSKIQEISYCNGTFRTVLRDVRKIPNENDFFENIWRTFRENGNIY